jgi:hypothetical protein
MSSCLGHLLEMLRKKTLTEVHNNLSPNIWSPLVVGAGIRATFVELSLIA